MAPTTKTYCVLEGNYFFGSGGKLFFSILMKKRGFCKYSALLRLCTPGGTFIASLITEGVKDDRACTSGSWVMGAKLSVGRRQPNPCNEFPATTAQDHSDRAQYLLCFHQGNGTASATSPGFTEVYGKLHFTSFPPRFVSHGTTQLQRTNKCPQTFFLGW